MEVDDSTPNCKDADSRHNAISAPSARTPYTQAVTDLDFVLLGKHGREIWREEYPIFAMKNPSVNNFYIEESYALWDTCAP
eukprot:3855681-Rhodomonas_salina.2